MHLQGFLIQMDEVLFRLAVEEYRRARRITFSELISADDMGERGEIGVTILTYARQLKTSKLMT